MTEGIALFARMVVIGVAVAAPVGAMGVLCIQRVLAHGWRAGIATGAGIATADGLYAAVAAFGISALSSLLVSAQTPLRLAGGAALVWLGVRAIIAPPAHDPAAAKDSTGVARLYASAVALTLTNPMTIMAFGAVFAGVGALAQATVSDAAIATAGVAAGSLLWWAALATVVARTRHVVSDRSMRWVNRISGAAVAAFGTLALWAGLLGIVS